MYNRKLATIALAVISASSMVFTGCNGNDNEAVPVTSDTVVEEIETEETEIESEPTNDNPATSSEDSLSEHEIDDTETDIEAVDTEDETTEYKDNLSAEASGGGEDTKTDEEIQAELEEQVPDSSSASSTDSSYDFNAEADASEYDLNTGFNKVTGQYNPHMDTNEGKGWDINGQHYETKGEYRDAIRGKNKGSIADKFKEDGHNVEVDGDTVIVY